MARLLQTHAVHEAKLVSIEGWVECSVTHQVNLNPAKTNSLTGNNQTPNCVQLAKGAQGFNPAPCIILLA
jgi:hypothetical protein